MERALVLLRSREIERVKHTSAHLQSRYSTLPISRVENERRLMGLLAACRMEDVPV